jgi:hypothetical protein
LEGSAVARQMEKQIAHLHRDRASNGRTMGKFNHHNHMNETIDIPSSSVAVREQSQAINFSQTITKTE